MKKRDKIISKCLSFILFFCLVMNIPVRAEVVLRNSSEEFALTSIMQISKDLPGQGWTDGTKINDAITTYDLDGNINGYIFNLKTNGNESGYIQIFQLDDKNYLISYSFQGRFYLDKMMDAYKNKDRNKNKKLRNDYKLIYSGNNNFLINEDTNENNTLYSLTSEQSIQEEKVKLKETYNKIAERIVLNGISSQKPANSTLNLTTTDSPKYVISANNADLVETADFSDKIVNGQTVDNHCSPTSGTNLIKYWAKRRGVSNLWYSSDFWVFSSLCINMKTVFSGDKAGTLPYDYLDGLKNYSTQTRGVSYSGYDFWGDDWFESSTFTKAKSIIDADVPFNLHVPGHDEVCFGYNTVNGAEQLIVNTGWDKYWSFLSFYSLDAMFYMYVRWN